MDLKELYDISMPPTEAEIELERIHLRRCADLGYTAKEYFDSVPLKRDRQ